MSILIDGRPIRDPISGSAVFVIELFKSLNELQVNPHLFLQSNKNKNEQLKNFRFHNSILSHGNKTLENIFYEIGFNSHRSLKNLLKLIMRHILDAYLLKLINSFLLFTM